jgi:hypothetical protein
MTPQQQAAVETIRAVADALRELKEVPSGHLYARLMGHTSLQSYELIISTLKSAGLVTEQNHLLTWVNQEETRRT